MYKIGESQEQHKLEFLVRLQLAEETCNLSDKSEHGHMQQQPVESTRWACKRLQLQVLPRFSEAAKSTQKQLHISVGMSHIPEINGCQPGWLCKRENLVIGALNQAQVPLSRESKPRYFP